DELRRYADEKEGLYRELSRGRLVALSGLERLLERLRLRAIPAAVATSAPPENVRHTLAELGLAGRLDRVVRADEVPHGKPHPDDARYLAVGQVAAEPFRPRLSQDRLRDAGGHAPQSRDRREEASPRQILFAYLGGESLGGGGEHPLADLARLGEQRAQPHARKDEDVVALADAQRPAAVEDRRERAPGSDEGAAGGPGGDVGGRRL